MKKITNEEFREYLEYKEFMGERPGQVGRKSGRKLDMDELGQIRAAKGKQDFEMFLKEIKSRSEEEE